MQAISKDFNVIKHFFFSKHKFIAFFVNLGVRHSCDQNDGIAGYGYHKHDGREFASQEINDKPSNIKFNTDFIKVPGGKSGGDWGVRIRGTPMNNIGSLIVADKAVHVC